MSGVFGIVDTHQRDAVQLAMRRMAERLKLNEHFGTQVWSDPDAGVGLGQVNIGIFSADSSPALSTDGAIIASMFGEINNIQELQQSLKAGEAQLPIQNETELILQLYEKHGVNLPNQLEGAFGLAIWDSRLRRLLVANDRFGLIPHYYTHFDGKLLFAPRVAGILQDPTFPRKLNLDALAEFFRFQRLLGNKTYWEGLYLLPYGSVLIFEPDSEYLSVSHYWDFDQTPSWPAGATFDEAVEETARLLHASVRQSTSGMHRVGVYLSGGLDSRTILGFASQMDKVPPSITYGHPNSTDVIYAKRVAKRLGSHNYYFPQHHGRWLQDHVDFHLSMTEGFTSFIHAHAAITLEPARDILDVNLTGFYGDQVLGARATDHAGPVVQAKDECSFLTLFYTSLKHDFSWPGVTEAEEKVLYTPDYYHQLRDRAFDSLRRELIPFNQYPIPLRVDFFMAIHQGTRLSNLNNVYNRAYFETRYPFCSYPLVDFVQSMPIEYRLSDRLYLAVVNRKIPQTTWIPRDTDDLLLTDRKLIRTVHGLGIKAKRRLQHWFHKGNRYQRIHGDPEAWLRDDLRNWVEGILFDKRTTERGIINPEFIRSIFERHMSGREIWTVGKIAPIITFEMMMRKYFDE